GLGGRRAQTTADWPGLAPRPHAPARSSPSPFSQRGLSARWPRESTPDDRPLVRAENRRREPTTLVSSDDRFTSARERAMLRRVPITERQRDTLRALRRESETLFRINSQI